MELVWSRWLANATAWTHCNRIGDDCHPSAPIARAYGEHEAVPTLPYSRQTCRPPCLAAHNLAAQS
jgi:hypothetical protein